MIISELEEFRKDLKTLQKRFRTLPEDIEVVKMVLIVRPDEKPPFSFRIDGLGIDTCVIKVKKIASRSLKGSGINSGFRLIYAYFKEEQKITLIELYFKGDKTIEDKNRILRHFK
jgi:mRNA-degrading endonuclease RelE of RelBE toxin-antitoxin system